VVAGFNRQSAENVALIQTVMRATYASGLPGMTRRRRLKLLRAWGTPVTRFAPLRPSAVPASEPGFARLPVRWPRAEWNATDRDLPDATVAQLFEEQAGRTPDVVALLFEDLRGSKSRPRW
jgi:non-ribosomal peptide synthetase component F